MKANLYTVAVTLGTALLLVGCNSSSSSSSNGSDDNGDSGGSADVSAVCDANVSVASNDSGVGSDGYDGLRFYRVADSVCAFDADAGVAFGVDDNDGDALELVVTSYSRSGGDLTADGVIYVADDHLWFADSDASAGSVSPTQVSSEDNASAIDMMSFAPDFAAANNGTLVYRKGADGWFAVQRGFGASSDPVALGDNREPLGPLYDGDQLTHAIIRDGSRLVLSEVSDLSGEAEELLDGGVISGFTNYVGMFGDGTAVLAVGSDFYFLDPGSKQLEKASGDAAETANNLSGFGALVSRGIRIDDVMYLALTDDGQAVLSEIDKTSQEINIVDEAETDNTTPVLLVVNDDYIGWGWSHGLGQEGESAVVVIERENHNNKDKVYNGGEDVIVTSQVPAHIGDWIFFNTADGDANYSARYVALETPGTVTELDDASWQGGLIDVSTTTMPFYVPDTRLDTVLLNDRNGEEEIQARAADDPSESTTLGKLPAQSPPADTMAPPRLLLGATSTLGPARLVSYGSGLAEILFYLDTRHSDSMVEIGEVEPDPIIIQGGF
ncbi:MAG: hypothetical protein LAT62_03305 [Natronospirillum sp.]|uniref:hypothetical protein n=1 Tax=Natronospirillum sp. TaxID=2812955 RepID=UPI0026008BD0|nr:hypothetical protein [Natronospirillum sp.]MCH8550937.1 hypothetical protein [Natronospirillum sp.]